MKEADEHRREMEALRERLTRLSEASLRVNESLDPDTVLQEVMDSARALTDARFGGITTFDESGQLLEFITSGLPPEEQQRMLDLPEGSALFEYFSSIQGSLRFGDVASQMRSLGFPDLPIKTLLGAPMRHRGEHVGNLYVAEKEGGREFTREDEETLVMFASQATMVVVNARRHRDEQRARADLEALINTSPVGVLVFDATTGALASLNREARRIFNDLHTPGRPLEQLLGVLTFRRADGREISVEEFPLAQALSTGETVRAEEIVIQIPDGRSVTTLVNATPISSEEGQVDSVVVTLQDMTPLEDLERLRAEFLGMVSHELQTPLASIRGSATTLLDDEPDLDPAEMRQFHRIIEREASRMRGLISDLLDVARIETGTLPVAPGPAEVAVLVDEARNAFLSAGGGNQLLIDLPPDLPWVMADRRRIVQVLGNLLSNAANHSPESSSIRVAAVREDIHVAVSVADDGRGVSAERLPHLFRKFSRTEATRTRGAVLGVRGWAWPSARGSWRPTGAASGPRATEKVWGRGSPSRFRWSWRPGLTRQPDPPGAPPPRQAVGAWTAAHSRRGRRPAGAQVRPRRPLQVGLCAGSDRRPGGGAPAHGGGEAPPGAVGPDAAGDRRDRADERHFRYCRRAGHLPVGVRPGRCHRQGLRYGGRRLRGQALLADGAGGEDQGGPAPAGGRRTGPNPRDPMCWAS